MENKTADSVLKSILSTNTSKTTPAVPVPDWSTPLGGHTSVPIPTVSSIAYSHTIGIHVSLFYRIHQI